MQFKGKLNTIVLLYTILENKCRIITILIIHIRKIIYDFKNVE